MSKDYMNGRKQGWLESCIAIHNFHVERIKIDSEWQYRDTARELHRSLGSISQAIKVARWLKTHENKIVSFSDLKSCLEWIREIEKERRTESV
jgi:hypothetical protein